MLDVPSPLSCGQLDNLCTPLVDISTNPMRSMDTESGPPSKVGTEELEQLDSVPRLVVAYSFLKPVDEFIDVSAYRLLKGDRLHTLELEILI